MSGLRELIELPPHMAKAVTNAVEGFSRRQNQQESGGIPVEADSFYHDEHIWFIRQKQRKSPDQIIVRRLQIAMFESSTQGEMAKLNILPDIYQYDPSFLGELKRLIDPAKVLANAQRIDLYNSKGEPYTYKTILKKVSVGLSAPWDFIQSIQS